MVFHSIFPNHPYIHEDKHLFATVKKLIVVVIRKYNTFACIKKIVLLTFH